MDQEPVQAPSEPTDAKPKIFQNINGVIAGVTGLVIALGGLAAATKSMWDKDPEPTEVRGAEKLADASQQTGQAAANQAVETAPAEAPTNDDPWNFTTDNGGTLRWVNGFWVEVDQAGTTVRYGHFEADARENVAMRAGAGPNGEDVYLRWPKAGGRAQRSMDVQESWRDAYIVTVDEKQPTA